MADSMSVTGSTTGIDISKWKKLTPQEIIKEESKGEEIPAEIVSWAQQMTALAKIPDDVTYEQVDGDVGIDALSKLGLDEEAQALTAPQAENAEAPTATEEPDAVKDPARPEELGQETTQDENIFMNPTPGYAAETGKNTTETEAEIEQEEQLTLADPTLTTDPEEIRKRKARRGLS